MNAINYSWTTSHHIIDSLIKRNSAFAAELREQVNCIAAKESIQKAVEWLREFEDIYKKVAKYPYLRKDIDAQLREKAREYGMRDACNWFKNFEIKNLRLNTGYLHVESNDREVVEEAKAMAAKCERMFTEELTAIKERGHDGVYTMKSAERLAIAICEGAGVSLPDSKFSKEGEYKLWIAGVLARLYCEKWWRRKLRRLQAVKLEDAARMMGMVCKRRGGYCSMASVRRRQFQKSRNESLLKKLEAENEEGQTFTLHELSELGVSNPALRRAELMTRLRGFEELADEIGGYTPAFITQTCPSRYHSHDRAGKQYPNWDGSTPRDAQEYLNNTWQKVRAAIDRAEIPYFGVRVCEPHHDGCPHWHMMVWVPSYQVDLFLQIYESYALKDDPPPKGKESVRFKALVDELASGATSYIAKYISKNIDGLKEDGTPWDANVVKTALRTEAWASTHNIRQFQQLGGPPVTVYREMRRLREEFTESEEVEAIRAAADAGDWKQYTIEMGGPVAPLKSRPLRAYMIKKLNDEKEKLKNAYGEHINKIMGVLAFGFLPVITRFHDWTIRTIVNSSPSLKGGVFQVGASPPLDLCQ